MLSLLEMIKEMYVYSQTFFNVFKADLLKRNSMLNILHKLNSIQNFKKYSLILLM